MSATIIDMKKETKKSQYIFASNLIKSGNLVVFPTETVYGIGADGLNDEAVKKIFASKKRAADNPLILHVSDFKMVDMIAKNISDMERDLMETFFPGPLTIILPKKEVVPSSVSGGLDTVGVRMPSNKIAHELIKYSNTPIAAPSANISGRPSGTDILDIIDELKDNVDCIIDGGPTTIGLESTVIRVVDDVVNILRPGKITPEDFMNYGFKVKLDKNLFHSIKKGELVRSPGMKYKHYAPKIKCLLIYSEDNNKFIKEVNKIKKEKRVLVICRHDNVKFFGDEVYDLGKTLMDMSHNIFHALREADKTDYDLVIIEGVKKEGLGIAIMNRLIRACSHNYIEL